MKGYMDPRHKTEILDAAIINGEFKLASGRVAHQKFEFDNIQDDSRLLSLTIDAIAKCIQGEFDQPAIIATVANGATCMGDAIAEQVGGRHVRTAYHQTENGKQFYLVNDVKPGEKVVVVDDVYTSGTNSGKVIDLLVERGAVLLGVAVLLNRSTDDEPLSRSVPVRYVIHKTLQ